MNGDRSKNRVVKLGGSLLDKPDFPDRVNHFLAKLPHRKTAIMIGGGDLIDAMRTLDDRFPLDLVSMHWRCVRLLRHTWEIAAELLPELEPIGSKADLQRWTDDPEKRSSALVAVDSFYFPDDPDSLRLPTSWATTTDSIAALLAHRLSAEELVLCKSCPLPDAIDWSEAARRELVDAAFPNIVEGIKHVTWTNLADGRT